MRYLILILCLLLAACQRGPVSSLTDTPDALKHLPPGTSLDFGDLRIDIVEGDKTVVTQPKAKGEPVIRKCKGCFNTDNSDRSKTKDKSDTDITDKSKTKDNSDTTVKYKPDQSEKQKNKTDNRVSMGQAYSSWFEELLKEIVVWVVAVVAGYLFFRYVVFR